MDRNIQIISAPSILGLKPTGVQYLPASLIAAGLVSKLQTTNPVIHVPTLNDQYRFERDEETSCLNPLAIHHFSLGLTEVLVQQIDRHVFPLVLGGDCSILLSIMPAWKTKGKYGLIFLDAHADFYLSHQSVTGEVADMDLAIITGRGPDMLTDIKGLKPYVADEHVIHIGQRDAEETKQYGSMEIKDTAITCFDLESIRKEGLNKTMNHVLKALDALHLDGFWIHFDTDVINDNENPAVDYRLTGGLTFAEVQQLINKLMATDKIAGMSVTIFNPELDIDGNIAIKISDCLAAAFKP
jgi:arginase